MPIAFAFLDDEGFLYEYLGNNTYSSEQALSIGDPGSPTTNVAINSTSISVGDPSSKVSVNSSSIAANVVTCNTLVLSVMPTNCADDAAAESAGIPVGGIYMNAGVLMVRQS